ncbi:MAG: SusC/RagA family TonB-linked outer membrane protein [Bacteroidales bacterium]|nr:SusC/RagA family TonB-linked outer membrane protein [Bacteroidales bacterium]
MKLRIIISFLIACFAITLAAQDKVSVSGVVKDEAGVPVAGATIMERGNPTYGVMADANGKYSINVPPQAFLEISCIGFKSAIEAVDGRTQIDVVLKMDNEALEAVVVIGYGTSKKGDLTGSVAVVEMEQLENIPASSVTQALQGRIAGAEFSSGTGEVGEAGSIRIRGSRSISAGNEPLIVVDGIVDAVESLSDLNPSDIVSISLLKDVSSTAIYGSRGANGVILVTTQTPNKQTGVFAARFKSTIGVSGIAGGQDLMNAEEYARWRNLVSTNLGSSRIPYPDTDIYRDTGTDWIKALSQTAFYRNHHLNLHGINGGTSWTTSFGYNNTPSVIIGSGLRKYTGSIKLSSKIKQRLTWGVNVNFVLSDKDNPVASITGTNTSAAIFLSPMLDKEDTWNKFGDGESYGGLPFNSPYLVARNVTSKTKNEQLLLSANLRYNFNPRLWAEARASRTTTRSDGGYYSPSTLAVANANDTGGTARRTHYDKDKYLAELTLNYKRSRSRWELETLAGFTFDQTTISGENYSGTGYLDDSLLWYNMAGLDSPVNFTPTSYWNRINKLSAFGRVNFNYRKRYYITATARADGASNFADNKKWGFFPAIALRWSIMNEPWFSKATWLNDMSFRLSAGRSGNDAISPYMSLASLGSSMGNWLYGNDRETGFYPSKLQNSYLTWETTSAINAGFDFAVWQNRLRLEIDAYVSWTEDLLLSVRNAQTTGYNTYYANAGSTRNQGVEFTLITKNIKKRDFEWTTTLTASHNSQIVTGVGSESEVVPTYMNPRNTTQYMYGYRKGYPVNALWGYKYEGVWHTQDEIDRNEVTHAYVSQVKPGTQGSGLGHPKYADMNHDGMLDQNDMVYLGTSDAILYGGIQNDFRLWNKLNLGIYVTWSIGGSIYNIGELWLGSGTSSYNKYRYMMDAWTEQNPDSDIVKAGFDDVQASSRHVYDASYLRLKTLSLDYDVPLGKKVKKYIKTCSVGIVGENLLLWKSYPGFDPDVNTSSSVYRLDNGSFPRPRTAAFNINIKF